MSNVTFRCPEAEEAAAAATKAAFPGSRIEPAWSDRRGARAVVVLDVDLGATQYLHQVVCLHEAGEWIPWSEGVAPGWLSVDEPFGLATDVQHLEAAVTAVKLRDFEGERMVDIDSGRMFRVLWDVQRSDSHWEWPVVVALRVAEKWMRPGLPGLAASETHLLDRYLRYEKEGQREDFWAWEAVNNAIDSYPRETWSFLQQAIRAAPDEETLFAIAAGALEDLIVRHSQVVLDDIETAAEVDAKLARALAGVWCDNEPIRRRLLQFDSEHARATNDTKSDPTA